MNWLIIRRCGSTITYSAFLSILYIYMSASLQMSPSDIGSVYAVLLLSNQIFALPAGIVGDRWGFRLPMILGCLVDAASYCILAFSSSAEGAFIAAVGIGLGGCLFSTNARAELLSFTDGDKNRTARVQGEFLRWTNIGALIGPVVGFCILNAKLERMPFYLFVVLELLLLIPILAGKPSTPSAMKKTAPVAEQGKIDQPSINYWRQFILLHLLAAIPVGLAASAPIVFPYVFDTILHVPADNSIAQFVRNFVIIVLQGWISIRLISTANIRMALVISGFLLFCLMGLATFAPSSFWLIAMSSLFGICQVIATTAIYNGIIFVGTPKGRAAAFGLSKLILALSTFCILKLIPSFLMTWQNTFQGHIPQLVSFISVFFALTLLAVFVSYFRKRLM